MFVERKPDWKFAIIILISTRAFNLMNETGLTSSLLRWPRRNFPITRKLYWNLILAFYYVSDLNKSTARNCFCEKPRWNIMLNHLSFHFANKLKYSIMINENNIVVRSNFQITLLINNRHWTLLTLHQSKAVKFKFRAFSLCSTDDTSESLFVFK